MLLGSGGMSWYTCLVGSYDCSMLDHDDAGSFWIDAGLIMATEVARWSCYRCFEFDHSNWILNAGFTILQRGYECSGTVCLSYARNPQHSLVSRMYHHLMPTALDVHPCWIVVGYVTMILGMAWPAVVAQATARAVVAGYGCAVDRRISTIIDHSWSWAVAIIDKRQIMENYR